MIKLLKARGLFVIFTLLATIPAIGNVSLKDAVVLTSPNFLRQEKKAVQMLIDEDEKRTLIRWPQTTNWPSSKTSVIAIGLHSQLKDFAGPYADQLNRKGAGPAEGFRLSVQNDKGVTAIFVIGNDTRGVLFGIGRLLRELTIRIFAADCSMKQIWNQPQ